MDKLIIHKNRVVSYMIGGNFTADSGWKHKVRYHHGDYELMVCLQGPISLLIGTDNVVLNKNDVLIVPPYTSMRGTVTSPKPIEFYWLHFLVSKAPLRTTGEPDKQSQIAFRSKYHLNDLSELLISIHELLTIDTSLPLTQERQDLLMTLILIQIAGTATDSTYEDQSSALIDQLKEWIRTNIYKSPTLTDIANETGLNPQYVSRVFKKYVSMSPKHYMIHLKIQTAQALLIRTNLSIKEVSHYAYYSDDKLFLKQFKQLSGVTPTEFCTRYQKIYHNNQVIDPVLPIPEEITQKLDNDRDPGSPTNSHS